MKNLHVFLILLLLLSCNDNNKKISQNESTLSKSSQIKVRCTKIIDTIFDRQLIFNGKITSIYKSNISFEKNSRLKKIKVKNGQIVNKGEVLALLENSLLKNEVEKAKIILQKAQDKFEQERINYGDNKLSSEKIKRLKVRSGLLEGRNNLLKAQIEYNLTILKSPFRGVVANLEKKAGDFITSSDVFCTIINPNTLEVSFLVLENEFDFFSKGQEVTVHSFSKKDKKYSGFVSEINPIVDKNGLIKIRAKITSKNTSLFDGMNVKVYINKPLKNVIVIPKEALVLRSNKEVVFSLKNGLSKWNYVEIVGENSKSYAIKKGLKATDTIIVSGNSNLSHDADVKAIFVSNDTIPK